MADRLSPGESLVPGGSIVSADGRFRFILQGDGNLVLYAGAIPYWASNTNGQAVARVTMQDDGNLVIYQPDGTPIWESITNGYPGAWLVLQNDRNAVIYNSDGRPLWATNTYVQSCMVPGFLPKASGLHFQNPGKGFPHVPTVSLPVGGTLLGLNDASNGLCGGMAFTVRDYFEAGQPVPGDTVTPTSGYLFDHITKRLIDSFDLLGMPPGPAVYWHLMSPLLPDHETWLSRMGVAPHGRSWVMAAEQWPLIKADIDSGKPSPIGLVKVKSANPFDMGENHQVLAYGYDLGAQGDLMLYLYDPNHPDDNDVRMSLSVGNPQHTIPVTYSPPSSSPVLCFFRVPYQPVPPPSPGDARPRLWRDLRWTAGGDIAVTSNADGRLEIFVVGADNAIYHAWEMTAGGENWSSPWERMHDWSGRHLAVSNNPDGRLELFVSAMDGSILHTWQSAPSNGWGASGRLGGPDQIGTDIAVARNQSGRLEAFVIGCDRAILRGYQTVPNTDHAWAGFWVPDRTSIWGQPGFRAIAAGENADGRLELFAIDAGFNIVHCWQTNPDTDFAWNDGGPLDGGQGKRLAVLKNPHHGGRLEVFVIGTDDRVYRNWQDRGWHGWEVVGPGLGKDLAVGQNQDGRLEIFLIGMDDGIWHSWQTDANNENSWTNWYRFSGGDTFAKLVVNRDSKGRLMVLGCGMNLQLSENRQLRANSTWLTDP